MATCNDDLENKVYEAIRSAKGYFRPRDMLAESGVSEETARVIMNHLSSRMDIVRLDDYFKHVDADGSTIVRIAELMGSTLDSEYVDVSTEFERNRAEYGKMGISSPQELLVLLGKYMDIPRMPVSTIVPSKLIKEVSERNDVSEEDRADPLQDDKNMKPSELIGNTYVAIGQVRKEYLERTGTDLDLNTLEKKLQGDASVVEQLPDRSFRKVAVTEEQLAKVLSRAAKVIGYSRAPYRVVYNSVFRECRDLDIRNPSELAQLAFKNLPDSRTTRTDEIDLTAYMADNDYHEAEAPDDKVPHGSPDSVEERDTEESTNVDPYEDIVQYKGLFNKRFYLRDEFQRKVEDLIGRHDLDIDRFAESLCFVTYDNEVCSCLYQAPYYAFLDQINEAGQLDLSRMPEGYEKNDIVKYVLKVQTQSFEWFRCTSTFYVKASKLETMGLTRDVLDGYFKRIAEKYGPSDVFTLKSLRQDGVDDIDRLGLGFEGDTLCDGILRNKFACVPRKDQNLFCRGRGVEATPTLGRLVLQVFGNSKYMAVDDIIDEIEARYGVKINEQQSHRTICATGLMISKDVVYKDKDALYEFVKSTEGV